MPTDILPDVKAVENLAEKYVAQAVPLSEIFSDPTFNCRGEIAALDVRDLARDIAERGLDSPIVIRPYSNPATPQYKYSIVAGHRRHLAFLVNQSTNPSIMTIPAFVRADMDELSARLLNVRENIHRKALNIKQEAFALSYFLKYKKDGKNLFTCDELANIFGQSRGWVQNRQCLLLLPNDIQDQAAAGILTAAEVQKLSRIQNKIELYETVRTIKERKLRNEKTIIPVNTTITKASSVLKAATRKKSEIDEMLQLLGELMPPGLHTRGLAWAAGNISTASFMTDVQTYCKENDLPFKMPPFITNALLNLTPRKMSDEDAKRTINAANNSAAG